MYEFETGDLWKESEITDFHKRHTINGKLASIGDINCTYNKIPLCIISNMSSKTVT
jgi:hypothetical protein